MHWSRHLLACLHRITRAELLIGARAVTRHPHFPHYVSPFPNDQRLGALLCFCWILSLLRTVQHSGGQWVPMRRQRSLSGFFFKRGRGSSSVVLTEHCAASVPVSVLF